MRSRSGSSCGSGGDGRVGQRELVVDPQTAPRPPSTIAERPRRLGLLDEDVLVDVVRSAASRS